MTSTSPADTSTSSPIPVWIKNRPNHVEKMRNVVLRVKESAKFGENLRGMADGGGELTDLAWSAVMQLAPTLLEINHSRNPLPQLITAIRKYKDSGEAATFFSRVRLVSIFGAAISCADLVELLSQCKLLAGFAFADATFTDGDWSVLLPLLRSLNVRAIDVSDRLDMLSQLDAELVKLGGSPGVATEDIKRCFASFVTVRVLVAQELAFAGETDAEELLECLPDRFPRLSTLVWDWNIVDPALTLDKRSIAIVQSLIGLYKSLELGCLAVVAYTPCAETKHSAGELARRLSESGAENTCLYRFASKGLSNGDANFSIVICGSDTQTATVLHKIYVEGRNSIPDLRHLLSLIDPLSELHLPPVTVDFGGFDAATIKKQFSEKTWNNQLNI